MSSTSSKSMNREKLETQLITKAWSDPAFKQQLLSDPRATIAKELGMPIPDKIKVQVLEEKADTFYLVIPVPSVAGTEGELSDLELEAVAGGCNKQPRSVTTERAVAGVRG
jgi:hypothetical protein